MENRPIYNIILKYVNKLVPNKRTPKYSSEYYLRNIITMLTTFSSWRALINSVHIDHNKKNHYKTISDIHRLWSRKGVYLKVFEEITNSNIIHQPDISDVYQLVIDSTLISNKYGIDNVGYGGETRKKKFTKLTALTDIEGKIINIIFNNVPGHITSFHKIDVV